MRRLIRELLLSLLGLTAATMVGAQDNAQPVVAEASEAAAADADPVVPAAPIEAMATPALLDALIEADFSTKRDIVEWLAQRREPAVRRALAALLEGQLNYRLADRRIVVAVESGEQMSITDVLTGESLGMVPAGDLDRIGTNNALRRSLRGLLAGFDLADPDSDVVLTTG